MAAEMVNKEKKRVPKLRFKEFEGEWELKKLGDVGKIRMCKRIFSSETTEEGDIPFYKIGTFGKEADAYITNELYLDYKERFSYPKIGDILMSASGTLGRTVVFDGSQSYFQDSNIVWIDNEEKLITNNFLFYIYQIVRYDSEGGTIQRLYNSIINNAKFFKPTLPEQQKIASFLRAVDTKLQQLNTKKEALAQYKKGVMQGLFSQTLRFKPDLSGVEGADDGEDFPDWEEKKLGEVGRIITGSTPSTSKLEYYNGEKLFVSPADIDNNRYVTETKKTLTELGFSKGRIVKGNSVLFVCIGSTIGKVAQASEECLTNQQINALVANKNNSNDFIYSLLSYKGEKIKLLAGVQAVPQINKTGFSNFKFNFPSLKEQQKIARYLSALDAKIAVVQEQIDKTAVFKKGLLQQLFV